MISNTDISCLDPKEIGKRLKKLRINSDETQRDLADLLGIDDKSTISKIENGWRILTLEQADRICQHYGISMNLLLHGNAVSEKDKEIDKL